MRAEPNPATGRRRPVWLVAAPFLFLAFWSGGFVFAKMGLRHAEPLTLLTIRFGLVVVSMAAVALVLRPPMPRGTAEWLHLLFVGLMMQAVYFGLIYVAFDLRVTAGTVALINSFQPIVVAIIAPWWAGERIGRSRWGGLALGLAGTAIVILARLEIASPALAGLACAAAAVASIIVATMWEKRFGRNHHPVTANLVGFSAAFAGILPAALIFETNHVTWHWELGTALAYLVVCNSLIATSLLLAMIRHGEVARVSALMFLIPPCAALLAWGVLGEVMPALAWPGMALAAAGVLITTRLR